MDKTRPFRHDALDKVTGAAMYAGDFHMRGMVYAKTLWPSFTCGRVLKIDLTEAKAAPGVVDIVTRRDITGPNLAGMLGPFDRPVLVGEGEEVHFGGDALALVAAESEEQAMRACSLIRVEYEELPAVHSVDQAIVNGNAPTIEKTIQKGNIDIGFAKSAVVVEGEYETPYAEHSYLEPEGGYAYIDYQGTICVCVGTQDVVQNHRMICKSLNLPYHKVRLKSPYVGGGFGGKHSMSVQVHLALLAHVLRSPVRLVWTREESLAYSSKKQALSANIKIGLDCNGQIAAYQARVSGPNSPYTGNAPDNLGGFLKALCGPYRIEHIDIKGQMFATTGPELGAFRGVAAPDGVFATEVLLNCGAIELGLSPIEVRRRNWMREHHEFGEQVTGTPARNVSAHWPMEKIMDIALEAAGALSESKSGKKIGRGIASAMPGFCTGNTLWHKGSVAEISLFLDGTILVKLGFPELGQGITGVITRLVSEELGIEEHKIEVRLSDSHFIPKAGALGFSQATVTGGNAVLDAVSRLKKLVEEKAQECLRTTESLHFYRGSFTHDDGSKALDWTRFADFCFQEVSDLRASGYVVGSEDERDQFGVTSVCGVADVEVDEETGEIQVLQLIQCHDTGKVIHYPSARGQMIGAAVMALGGTLMEEFKMANGRTTTPSLAEYLIPTSMDTPTYNKVVFYENNPGKGCPHGAKGLGEHGMYTIGGAIANAVMDATGACILSLPITPEKVLRALGKL